MNKSQVSMFANYGLLIILLCLVPSNYSQARAVRPVSDIFFPQTIPPKSAENESSMMALITGKLILENGCLRLENSVDSRLIIWPGWYSFDVEGEVISVIYTQLATTVARLKLGGTVTLGGGEVPYQPNGLLHPIPKNCPGPYWMAGEVR
jgi:hypothetical protein